MKIIVCDVCDKEIYRGRRLKVACKRYRLNNTAVERSRLDVHKDCWYEVLQIVKQRNLNAGEE